MTLLVDPPSGWRYGFPRPYDKEKDGPLKGFLLRNGYPENDIDFALDHCRYIGDYKDLPGIDVV